MKPCIYSSQANKVYGKQWFRGGFDVRYCKNEKAKQKVKGGKGKFDDQSEGKKVGGGVGAGGD